MAINKRDKLYRKYVKSNSVTNYRKLKEQSKFVSELIIDSKKSRQYNLCESLGTTNTGSKNYWQVIKKLMGNKFSSEIPSLNDGNIIAANILNTINISRGNDS